MLHKLHVPIMSNGAELGHRPINDAEWKFLEPFIIETPRRPGRPARNHRLSIDGIVWIACTGAPWRSLPKTYGNWGSVHRQFLRWTKAGLWEGLLEALKNTPDTSDGYEDLDRQSMAALIKQAQQVALRPRSTQGKPRTIVP